MRPRDVALRLGRVGFATTSVVAMTSHFTAISDGPAFNPTKYLGFFTIQTNVLAAAMLALAATAPPDGYVT